MKKEENPHILSQRVKSHLSDYSNHLKIYAYGSVLENEQADAGFVIPETKTEKSFYLGNGRSIFTAQLVALFMEKWKKKNQKKSFSVGVICPLGPTWKYLLGSFTPQEQN